MISPEKCFQKQNQRIVCALLVFMLGKNIFTVKIYVGMIFIFNLNSANLRMSFVSPNPSRQVVKLDFFLFYYTSIFSTLCIAFVFFFITLCDLSNWYWAIAYHSSFGFWSGGSSLVNLFLFTLICLIEKYSINLYDCYSESNPLHSRLILVTIQNQAM